MLESQRHYRRLIRNLRLKKEREEQMDSLGRIAYAAYARSTGGKTYDGRTMPEWSALTDAIRDAWEAAARAVADVVLSDPVGPDR